MTKWTVQDTWNETTPHYLKYASTIPSDLSYVYIELDEPVTGYKRTRKSNTTGSENVYGWFVTESVTLDSDVLVIEGYIGVDSGYHYEEKGASVTIALPSEYDVDDTASTYIVISWFPADYGWDSGSTGNYIYVKLQLTDPPTILASDPGDPTLRYSNPSNLVNNTVSIMFGLDIEANPYYQDQTYFSSDSYIETVIESTGSSYTTSISESTGFTSSMIDKDKKSLTTIIPRNYSLKRSGDKRLIDYSKYLVTENIIPVMKPLSTEKISTINIKRGSKKNLGDIIDTYISGLYKLMKSLGSTTSYSTKEKKRVDKKLSNPIDYVASVTYGFYTIFKETISSTLTIGSKIMKYITKEIKSGYNLSSSIVKSVKQVLSTIINPLTNISKKIDKPLSDTLGYVSSVSRNIVYVFKSTYTYVSTSLIRDIVKSLRIGYDVVSGIVRRTSKIIRGGIDSVITLLSGFKVEVTYYIGIIRLYDKIVEIGLSVKIFTYKLWRKVVKLLWRK